MGQDAATPPGLWDRIRDLVSTEVSKLLRSGLLRNASISEGGLTIRGGFLKLRAPGAVSDTFFVGGVNPPAPDGGLQPGVVLRRNDGSIAFMLRDASPLTDGYFQHFDFFDRSGNPIISDDATSGQGLGRPWLPIPLYPREAVGSAGRIATTSTAFTTLWMAAIPKQQPTMVGQIILGAPAGATAEARLVVNGTQVGALMTAAANEVAYKNMSGAVPGTHMQTLTIEVQARVSSGSGAVSVGMHRLEGRQS